MRHTTDNCSTANWKPTLKASAFGSLLPNRTYSSNTYKYGFNGKGNDNEVMGSGNQYDYGFRIYDPRIGRFLSVDPLYREFPYYTPYQFAGNMPIWAIDLDGLEQLKMTAKYSKQMQNQMNIITSSAILARHIVEISRPDRKATHTVWFAVINSPGSENAFTQDLKYYLDAYDSYRGWTKESVQNHPNISPDQKEFIITSIEIFENAGIQAENVRADINAGKSVWIIAVNESSLGNGTNTTESSTHTIMHEIVAHLELRLNGVPVDAFKEHMDFYFADLIESGDKKALELYNKYADYLMDGYSLSYDEILPKTPAGDIKKAVEDSASNYSTGEATNRQSTNSPN